MDGTENSNTQTDPAAGGQSAAAAASVAAALAKPAADKPAKPGKKKAVIADDAETDPAVKPNPNPQTVEIWPLRSYEDAGEIKRRGGPSYSVPKRHADALITRGLATDEEPAKASAETDK